MRGPGILGKLFGRKRVQEAPSLTIEEILGRALSSDPGTPAQALEIEAAEKEVRACTSGLTSAYSTGADSYELVVLYPAACLESAAAAPAAGDDPLRALVLSTEARLSRLLALGPPAPEGESEGVGRSAGARPVMRVLKRYGEADRDELFWRIADCTPYRVGAGPTALLVFVSSQLKEVLSGALERSPEYRGAAPAASEVPQATGIELCSPHELVAGSLFLPPRVACGNHVVQARFQTVLTGAAALRQRGPPGDPIWLESSCLIGGKPFMARYAYDVGSPEKVASMAQTVRQLAACEMREAIRLLEGLSANVGVEKPQVLPSTAPDEAARAGCLLLRAALVVGALAIPCEIWLPGRSLALLCAAAMDAWEYRQVLAEKPQLLVALLSLNQSLLRRSVTRLHAEYLETRGSRTRPADAPTFPFSAFLELAPDRDARLALQNHVLQSLGTNPLRALFSYAETVRTADGRQLTRTATPYAVDEARLLRFLPRAAAEAWRQPPSLPDRAAHLELNAEIMRGIRVAVRRGRLLLSRRARFILDRMYYPTVRAGATAGLDALVKARVPFADLEKLPRPRIQEILGRTATRAVGLALIGAENETALVRAHLSTAKGRQLAEELALLRRQLEAGGAEIEDVIEAKQSLAAEARRILEADNKQAARGKARTGAVNL